MRLAGEQKSNENCKVLANCKVWKAKSLKMVGDVGLEPTTR